MIINMGSAFVAGYNLTIETSANADISLSKNDRVITEKTDVRGIAIFKNLPSGTWTINVSKGELSVTKTLDLHTDESIGIVLNTIPDFEYSVSAADGGYKIYDANGIDITENPETDGDWKIKFLKSGEWRIIRLNGATDGIDVFCVGGGGGGGGFALPDPQGGGGGGRTVTERNVQIEATKYNIVIGAGGEGGTSNRGGTTIFAVDSPISVSAEGGFPGYGWSGGDGGSGGGAQICAGGSDGSDGATYANSPEYTAVGGKGLDDTTREFHESTGQLYAGGGGGLGVGTSVNYGGEGGGGHGGHWTDGITTTDECGIPGMENTGGGGGGKSASGGCGVVVIRNKR